MSELTQPRITERKFYGEVTKNLTADGTTKGLVTVDSTYLFKVGQQVSLKSNTFTQKIFKVKGVISETELLVGDPQENINQYSDISTLLVADGATIILPEQKRQVIHINEIERAVYEEEPTIALRTHTVDYLGRPYTSENPLSVRLSDGNVNIGTVNAELEVQLTHKDAFPDAGDIADSVRIGDGQDELEINPDGSINTIVIEDINGGKTLYEEISSVASVTPTQIMAYTTPIGKTTVIDKICVSGTNMSTYTITINNDTIDKKRTYFGSSIDAVFDFNRVLSLQAGDTLRVIVEHGRQHLADYNARISLIER